MRRRRLYFCLASLFAITALGLVLTFVVVPGISKDANSPVSSQMVASAPNSPAAGISVHGHWTIEIKNPDGTLVESREFDNALEGITGQRFLVRVLSRQESVGGWTIGIHGTPATQHAFMDSSSSRQPGFIVEDTPTARTPATHVFHTLVISVPSSGEIAGMLVLNGTATAQVDGNIGRVTTEIWGLDASYAPTGSYRGVSQYAFTTAALSSPVTLTTGQSVTVSVVISFS